ncbi:hypothetical protein Tco_0719137 [Tanacetum coccineum]
MSSPNHPTSNVKDAFSLNFPNYLPVSPDYFPASPGNTYSSSLNSFEDKIEGLEKGRVIIRQDFDNLEAELQQTRAQISKLQKKHMGNNHKISLARFRIIDLEHIINDIQIRHQEDKESLLNAINELKISQEGPSDY